MVKVIDSRPVGDFLQDIFESDELSINIVIFNMGTRTNYRPQKPTVRHLPTNPPAQKGKAIPVPKNNRDRWGRKI